MPSAMLSGSVTDPSSNVSLNAVPSSELKSVLTSDGLTTVTETPSSPICADRLFAKLIVQALEAA